MKRIYQHLILFVSIVSIVYLSSCGDDDDDDSGSIVGDWESTSFSLTNCVNGDPDLTDFGCGRCFLSSFNEDNSFSSTVFVPSVVDSTIVGTYSINGSELTTCDENGENCEISTFTLIDGVLILSSQDLGCSIEINFVHP